MLVSGINKNNTDNNTDNNNNNDDNNKTKVESDQLGRLLKSPIFVAQKAAVPKNGVKFRQKFNGFIRFSLATLYNNVRCRATS